MNAKHEGSLDLGHLRSWIGRSAEEEDDITPRLVAEYRATLDPHLAPVAEGDAPLALHWCLSPTIAPTAELGADGHAARGGFLPPVALPRRMWAGGSVETLAPLKIGDRVARRSSIRDVNLKTGRSGTLCFVAVEHEYATGRGLAVRERHDIVYREASSGGSAPAAPAERTETRRPDLTWRVDANAVLLFRYSAMTFNGHRIHYDQPYVTGVEGYAGLVVHGPIQATLLFNLASVLAGAAPRRFDYRGLAPLTAPQTFTANVRRDGGGALLCWTEDEQGRVCMEARCSGDGG